MERIDIELINLRYDKFTEVLKSYIELNMKYIRYVVEVYSDTPNNKDDLELGWENNYKHVDEIVLKHAITCVGRQYLKDSDTWMVWLAALGLYKDMEFIFTSEEKSLEFQNKLLNYLLS